jgi:hypothetical protein
MDKLQEILRKRIDETLLEDDILLEIAALPYFLC